MSPVPAKFQAVSNTPAEGRLKLWSPSIVYGEALEDDSPRAGPQASSGSSPSLPPLLLYHETHK